MRKVNFLFAAVFAAAIIVGAVNVFVAVGVDKKGVDTIDKVGTDTVFREGIGTVDKDGIGVIDKHWINVYDRCGVDVIRKMVINAADKDGAGAIDKAGMDTIDAVDKNAVSVVRKGRRIQVDGFLLEWRGANANVWPGSNWRWDAVSTADGVAGYVSLPAGVGVGDKGGNAVDTDSLGSVARSDLVVTLCAVNTGRSLEIRLPGGPSGEFFAFDRGAFDADRTLTAEWIVPWDYFKGGADSSSYELALVADGLGAGGMRYALLTVAAPEEPRASGGLLTRLAMCVLIAVLTVALIVIRRRQARERCSPTKRL